MMDRNSQLAKMQAEDSVQRGYEQAAQWKAGARKVIGSQRAAAAGAGVLVAGGSVGRAQASAQLVGDLGAEKIRANAAKEAWYLKMQAAMYSAQARMARATQYSPGMALAGSLLGSLGGMASTFGASMNEIKLMGGTVPAASTAGDTSIDWGSAKSSTAGMLSGGIA
jgi:hypothetical protein